MCSLINRLMTMRTGWMSRRVIAVAAGLPVALYVAAYCYLRAQDRFIVYRGEVLYGRWTNPQSLFSKPLRGRSFEVSWRPDQLFAPLANLELAAWRVVSRVSPIEHESGVVPIHGIARSGEKRFSDLPLMSQWKLRGCWYDHLEWSDRESYHRVYEASGVSAEVLRTIVLEDLADRGGIEDRALSEPMMVGSFVFPVASVWLRCVGDGGHWREVLFDEKRSLLCLSTGVDG